MRNQKKWLIGMIVILVLMNVTILGFFWFGRNGRPNPSRITNHFAKELNLSTAQKSVFEMSFETHLENNKKTMDSIMIQKEKMLEVLVQKEKDFTKLNQFIERIGRLEANVDRSLVRHYMELEEACESEEQLEKLQQIFKKSIPKPKHRRERGPK